MKASETTLRRLLEGSNQFQIPLFQRPYSWKEKNWETLWEDLISLYNNDDAKSVYFLGSIVTQSEPGTADGISPYIVIDGQQRLTTLSILLAALRNHVKKSSKEMAEQIYNCYLINQDQKNEDVYKVLPTQDDRDVYKSIIDHKTLKNLKKEGQIYEAYKFFEDLLKKPIPEQDIILDYAKLKTVILERLVLVNITTDNNDNPYLIFESLNNKGEELTQADLIRNYIFMKLPSEERDDVYNNHWLPLQDSFKKNMKPKEYADELTKAFWFYLRKDGVAINEKEVYKVIKKRFDDSMKVFEKPEDGIKAELENLIQFTNYYQRIKFYDQEEPESKLKYWFARLMNLDFTTCQIFILNVYHEYEEKHLSLQKFEDILRYLESYFVRRWVLGISTRALGTVFNNLYKLVKQKNPNDLVNGLREVMIGFEKTQVWPDNDSFRQHLINNTLYSKTSTANERVKFILTSIEASLSKERVEPQNLSIEHVMPQKLNKAWQTMLGENHNSVHKKWLHTLGNLTLTAYNSELSNKSFEDKLNYLSSSNVTLNQYFRNESIWNEEAIKNRAEYLADIAVKVWSR
jgi:uncharacterized protein with ParB-like and HNH nuclease domain